MVRVVKMVKVVKMVEVMRNVGLSPGGSRQISVHPPRRWTAIHVPIRRGAESAAGEVGKVKKDALGWTPDIS